MPFYYIFPFFIPLYNKKILIAIVLITGLLYILIYKSQIDRKITSLVPKNWDYLQVGQRAPDFKTMYVSNNQRTHKEITLSDLIKRKKKIVLYFYPKDGTPFCTKQAKSFIKHHEQLSKFGYEIIGISKDSIEKHLEIIDKYNIPFKLISDPNYTIHEKYGACKTHANGQKSSYRITFIVDKQGVIQHIIKKINITDHALQVLEHHNQTLKT